jgi:Transposase DDE domain
MNTIARVLSSVHEILELAQLRDSLRSVVRTVVEGITAAGSVVLSELLRPQVQKEELHAAEQRVSHALQTAGELDKLPDAYLAMVAPVARALRFRSIDGSDLSKPAGRKFEHLDVIRDGSSKPRDRAVVGPGGVQTAVARSASERRNEAKRQRRSNEASHSERAKRRAPRARAEARAKARKADRLKYPSPAALKKLGYWMVEIEAGDGKGNHLPLFQDVFSTQAPDYQALGENAWTRTFQLALEHALKYLDRGGIWLMDRGFDDIVWMSWIAAMVEQYVIRLKSNRLIHPGTEDATAVNILRFAQTLEARHTTQVRSVDKSTHQEKYRTIPFAWAPIWIDGVEQAQYLVVGHTGRKRPLLLITNRRPESPQEAGELIQAYLERWGNEEVTRACKQLTGLERIRVRKLQAIRRLVWLAMIAVGIQALSILTRPRWTQATLNRAKEFIRKVRFVLYRVWRVVQQDVLRALQVRPFRFA